MADDTTTTTTATATTPPKAKAKAKAKARSSAAPVTANQMAALLSKRTGRTVTAKSVRQWCRDNVEQYGDDRYTVHQYDARMQARIVAAWDKRTARRTASHNGNK
jgi:SMC interacting uncharacterized protein involved in chromosome segregation